MCGGRDIKINCVETSRTHSKNYFLTASPPARRPSLAALAGLCKDDPAPVRCAATRLRGYVAFHILSLMSSASCQFHTEPCTDHSNKPTIPDNLGSLLIRDTDVVLSGGNKPTPQDSGELQHQCLLQLRLRYQASRFQFFVICCGGC